MVLTDIEYLLSYLEAHHVPTIKKKRHTYLTYHGLAEHYTYVLKDGIIKNSIILQDGREYNLSYIAKPDVISLLRDEVSRSTDQPFNVRIWVRICHFLPGQPGRFLEVRQQHAWTAKLR